MTADTLAEQIRHLPTLAHQAAERTIEATYGGSDGSGIRTAPTSKPPAGVNLDRVDLDRGRHHPALLARLGQCIRVALEECPSLRDDGPDPSEEGTETWVGECRWLLATMETWTRDPWCHEWIASEVVAITGKLRHKIERRAVTDDGRDGLVVHRCSVCGGRIDAYVSESLAVAECSQCERVIAMRERPRPRAEAVQRQTLALARAMLGLSGKGA